MSTPERTQKYYRLKHDIPNPRLDRRKTGFEKEEILKAGRIFAASYYQNRVHPLCTHGTLYTVPLTDDYEECEPTPWQRYLVELSGLGSSSQYMLKQLVEKGIVTFEQMEEIYNDEAE